MFHLSRTNFLYVCQLLPPPGDKTRGLFFPLPSLALEITSEKAVPNCHAPYEVVLFMPLISWGWEYLLGVGVPGLGVFLCVVCAMWVGIGVSECVRPCVLFSAIVEAAAFLQPLFGTLQPKVHAIGSCRKARQPPL